MQYLILDIIWSEIQEIASVFCEGTSGIMLGDVVINELEIEAMEIAEDHVHIFLDFPLRYSISNMVKRFK